MTHDGPGHNGGNPDGFGSMWSTNGDSDPATPYPYAPATSQAPPPGYAAPALYAPRKRTKLPIIVASVGAVFVLCLGGTVLIAATSDRPQPETTTAADGANAPQPVVEAVVSSEPTPTVTSVPQETTAAPAPVATTKAPVVKQTTEAPPKPELSVEEQNAVESAESYLDSSSFSRKSLIAQLKYEGYPAKIATRTVDFLRINFKQQAVRKAESYLDSSSFSRKSLIEQLEYEGFTDAQATYGVDSLSVDYKEQAVKKAESYLDSSSFSRTGLIEQLEYEGFTHAQAVYGVNKVM